MKKLFAVSGFMFLLFLFACGNDSGGGSTPSGNAPSISNLFYSPQTVPVGYGSGATTISGQYDFIDLDGNISTITIQWYDTLGHSGTISGSAGASGIIAGRGWFYIVGASTMTATTYTFNFYVTDTTSQNSNQLTGTFTVY